MPARLNRTERPRLSPRRSSGTPIPQYRMFVAKNLVASDNFSMRFSQASVGTYNVSNLLSE